MSGCGQDCYHHIKVVSVQFPSWTMLACQFSHPGWFLSCLFFHPNISPPILFHPGQFPSHRFCTQTIPLPSFAPVHSYNILVKVEWGGPVEEFVHLPVLQGVWPVVLHCRHHTCNVQTIRIGLSCYINVSYLCQVKIKNIIIYCWFNIHSFIRQSSIQMLLANINIYTSIK